MGGWEGLGETGHSFVQGPSFPLNWPAPPSTIFFEVECSYLSSQKSDVLARFLSDQMNRRWGRSKSEELMGEDGATVLSKARVFFLFYFFSSRVLRLRVISYQMIHRWGQSMSGEIMGGWEGLGETGHSVVQGPSFPFELASPPFHLLL